MNFKWLWALVDMQAILIAILGVTVYALAISVNPPTKAQVESAKPPGDLMACITWDGYYDIDLWGGPPDQEKATGYSNKNDKTLDLVRDDLGVDTIKGKPKRMECQFARGLPDGRWVFNIHGYSIIDVDSVSVHAEIRQSNGDKGFTLIKERDMDVRNKQERTIIQFMMKDGKVVEGSENEVYVPLRSAGI